MRTPVFLLAAAINGLLVVALGAFGAHALEAMLTPAAMSTWQTGVQYQMFHTVGLVVVYLLQGRNAHSHAHYAGYAFIVGILLFSGSLYVLALSGLRWLGLLTPLGGLAFIAGWFLLARECRKG